MKLFVPVVGSKLKLLQDITVEIKNVGQNKKFAEKIKSMEANKTSMNQVEILNLTLTKGLILQVDRVYIRKGDGSDFNSFTFLTDGNEKGIPKGRFFISIDDANKMEIDVIREKAEEKKDLFSVIRKMNEGKSYLNRVPGYDLMSKIIDGEESKSSGTIFFNFEKELDHHLEYLNENIKRNNLNSLFEAKEIINNNYGKDAYDIIKGNIEFVKNLSLEIKEFPIIYFEVFIKNEEIILKLKQEVENKEAMNAINALKNLRNSIRCAISSISKNNFYTMNFPNAYESLIDDRSNGPETLLSVKRMYGANKEIFRGAGNNSNFAFLLEKGFASSFLFNTKYYKTFDFKYVLDSGEVVDMPKLRRSWKGMIKKD